MHCTWSVLRSHIARRGSGRASPPETGSASGERQTPSLEAGSPPCRRGALAVTPLPSVGPPGLGGQSRLPVGLPSACPEYTRVRKAPPNLPHHQGRHFLRSFFLYNVAHEHLSHSTISLFARVRCR